MLACLLAQNTYISLPPKGLKKSDDNKDSMSRDFYTGLYKPIALQSVPLLQPIDSTYAPCFSALNVLPRPPFPHSPALCSSARPLLAWQSSRGKGGRTDQPIERPWAPSRLPSTWRACGAERKRGREKRRARLSAFTSAEKAPKTSTRKGRFGNANGGEPRQSIDFQII